MPEEFDGEGSGGTQRGRFHTKGTFCCHWLEAQQIKSGVAYSDGERPGGGRQHRSTGKVELVTLAIPTHTQRWAGTGYSRPQPGRKRDFTLLLGPAYFSGSPIGRGKTARGSSASEWGGDWQWGAGKEACLL